MSIRLKRISYLTLLEILMVLVILLLVTGVIAINVRKFYLQQATLNEMNQVAGFLKNAEELMMIINLDSEVTFQTKDKNFEVGFDPQSSIPPFILPALPQKPLSLTYIDSITFEDVPKDVTLKPKFNLSFYSQGFVMNQGVLQMKGNGVTRSLIFYGYPAPVTLEAGERVFYPYAPELKTELEVITSQTGQETQPLKA